MKINLAPIFLAASLVKNANAFLPVKPQNAIVSKVDSLQFPFLLQATRVLATTEKAGFFEGKLPPRSIRQGIVGELPKQNDGAAVKISKSVKELTYVEDIFHIDSGPISAREVVKAWTLENEFLSIKGVLMGGNLMGFVDKETGEEYLWLNKEGAVGYGPNSNAFPLTRGLFLHGGIRMAAVTAEHGLYYDTEWDLDFEVSKNGDEASLTFTIKDDAEARELLQDPLSTGGFSSWAAEPMKNYPVTNANFIFKVTLRKGEKFLRTECTVENTTDGPIQAEAWMPQTWPITEESQIISHQKKRRIKGQSGAYVTDSWVMTEMINDKFVPTDMGLVGENNIPQYDGTVPYTTDGKEGPKNGWVINYPPAPLDGITDLNHPLQWPSAAGGILYDYPTMDGNYHAVSFGDGRGVAYVAAESTPEKPNFTKMWSWGNPKVFDRVEAANKDPPLAAGRPKTEYYEPWASGFNSAFFELYQFPPGKKSWEARFVPIAGGLDADKKQHQLREVVDKAVVDAVKSLD